VFVKDGAFSSTFLFWNNQRIYLTVLHEGNPVTCSLRLENQTPVVDQQREEMTVEISQEAFSWSFGRERC